MTTASNVVLFPIATRLTAANDDRSIARLKHPGLRSIGHRPVGYRPVSGSTVTRVVARPSSDADPYLLVLLADQEIASHRLEQASSLIEAAYAAYDQCRFGS
ncbi:MAG TPA: hypothetical protein VGM32_18510 [Rhodopila sp.]